MSLLSVCLFVHLVVYLYQYAAWVFILWVILMLCICYWSCCSFWPVGILAGCLLCLLTYFSSFTPPFTSLFSYPMILSKCILYFHSPSPGFDQFPKEPWFLLMENSIQKPTLGALCNHCYWGTTPLVPLSGESYEICVRFCLVLVL